MKVQVSNVGGQAMASTHWSLHGSKTLSSWWATETPAAQLGPQKHCTPSFLQLGEIGGFVSAVFTLLFRKGGHRIVASEDGVHELHLSVLLAVSLITIIRSSNLIARDTWTAIGK